MAARRTNSCCPGTSVQQYLSPRCFPASYPTMLQGCNLPKYQMPDAEKYPADRCMRCDMCLKGDKNCLARPSPCRTSEYGKSKALARARGSSGFTQVAAVHPDQKTSSLASEENGRKKKPPKDEEPHIKTALSEGMEPIVTPVGVKDGTAIDGIREVLNSNEPQLIGADGQSMAHLLKKTEATNGRRDKAAAKSLQNSWSEACRPELSKQSPYQYSVENLSSYLILESENESKDVDNELTGWSVAGIDTRPWNNNEESSVKSELNQKCLSRISSSKSHKRGNMALETGKKRTVERAYPNSDRIVDRGCCSSKWEVRLKKEEPPSYQASVVNEREMRIEECWKQQRSRSKCQMNGIVDRINEEAEDNLLPGKGVPYDAVGYKIPSSNEKRNQKTNGKDFHGAEKPEDEIKEDCICEKTSDKHSDRLLSEDDSISDFSSGGAKSSRTTNHTETSKSDSKERRWLNELEQHLGAENREEARKIMGKLIDEDKSSYRHLLPVLKLAAQAIEQNLLTRSNHPSKVSLMKSEKSSESRKVASDVTCSKASLNFNDVPPEPPSEMKVCGCNNPMFPTSCTRHCKCEKYTAKSFEEANETIVEEMICAVKSDGVTKIKSSEETWASQLTRAASAQVQTSATSFDKYPCNRTTCPKLKLKDSQPRVSKEVQCEAASEFFEEFQLSSDCTMQASSERPKMLMAQTEKLPPRRTKEMEDRLCRRICYFDSNPESVCNKDVEFCLYRVHKTAGSQKCKGCPKPDPHGTGNKNKIVQRAKLGTLNSNEIVVGVDTLEIKDGTVCSLLRICRFVYVDYVFLGHVGNETFLAPLSKLIRFDSQKSFCVSMRYNKKARSILKEMVNPSGLLAKDEIMFILVCQAAPEANIHKNWDCGYGTISMKRLVENVGSAEKVSREVEMFWVGGKELIGKLTVVFDGMSLIRKIKSEDCEHVETSAKSVMKKLKFAATINEAENVPQCVGF